MEENKKSAGKIDRLVMGIILGGAIGSVLGLTLAPHKGKETRNILKQKGKEFLEKGKDASEKFIRDHKESLGSAKYQIKKGKGFFRWLFANKQKDQSMPKVTMEENTSIDN